MPAANRVQAPAPRARRERARPEPVIVRSAAARPEPGPSPRLLADLCAVAIVLLAVLLALGLYWPGSAGVVGVAMVHLIRLWMGHVGHVAPLLFLAAGLLLAMQNDRVYSRDGLLGMGGLLAVLFGWVHLMVTPAGAVWHSTGARLLAMLGRRADAELVGMPDGGLLGALVMMLLSPMGAQGSLATLAALGVISVLLITRLTLRAIFERAHERSKIAAEGARRSAQAVGQAARQVADCVPRPRRKSLFLELSPGEEPDEPRRGARREAPRSLVPVQPAPREIAPAPRGTSVLDRPPSLDLDLPDDPGRLAPAPPTRRDRPRRRREETAPVAAGDYLPPPLELLEPPAAAARRAASEAQANIEILESTLGQFRIEAQVVEIADGPSVTRYEIRLGEGVRVRRILDLADNIAMSLAAMSVRVEAPIPGKAAIGIEVPKKHPAVVTLRECLEANESRDQTSKVAFVLGKDVAGEVRCADLARMPHLLVAGATNSGKSVCLNVLIASMLFRARPDELKFIMIDPKRVELTLFDGIPHLIHPVVKDVKQAAGILRWVLKEMDRRYDLFAHVMTRNVEGYNEKVAAEPEKRLPYIVVVIDELADLMMQQGPEVEQAICRLAQLARATGIHLVIATQRPSVDVITGLIKANVPSRIAFSVSSQIDSRTILDGKGAESLIGRGDMLFKAIDAIKPIRIQGAFLREREVEALVAHLKAQGRPEYIAVPLSVDHGAAGIQSDEEADDDLFEPAARFVVTTGHASTSMIQRKFKIGYTRAARLVDLMEARGIVGALDGAKPRELLMTRDRLDAMFAEVRNSLFRGDRADRRAEADYDAEDDYDEDDDLAPDAAAEGDEDEEELELIELEDTGPRSGPFTD